MKKPFGNCQYVIWVDHKKAIVACQGPEGPMTTVEIPSDIEGHVRFGGETSNKTRLAAHTLNRSKKDEQKQNNQVKAFMKQIATRLKRPEGILVLGPGTARFDLINELGKRKSLTGIPITSKPADKMKLHEIRDAMKSHFSLS